MTATSKTIEPRYMSHAETAVLIRAALKKAFPGVKFSVRSDRGSVRVGWTDGPIDEAVTAIVKPYQGARFDGMVDYGYSADLWLMPDGSAIVASDPGTLDQRGSNPPERNWMPCPEAVLIHNSVYVSTSRNHSDSLMDRARAWIDRRGGWEGVWQARDYDHAVWLVCRRAVVGAGNAFIVRKDY